ncbi:uncharacterized protein LOC125675234 isoform X2 [Ostrea edulis]|nr:uncharacterized protein LOC125675234 isoform X2 [Ostrea edulis]XP_056013729.1 uncharacterized protein LOC125675234 isoform X2 [Ostrea edulis]
MCCIGFYGYVWNETVHNCTRCTIGFYGDRCAFPCSFPLYGIKCAFHCNCSKEECHHQYGCKRSYGEINTTIWDENADSSSPATVPLTTTTKSNPLSIVNENSNELAAESNNCIGKGNGSIITDNTETLRYAIIGLRFVCCVFLIFYIGLHIIFNKYIPKVQNRQEHEKHIVV